MGSGPQLRFGVIGIDHRHIYDQVGSLLGGSVIVESVFAWPGLGQLAYQSLFARDFNLLLGIFFLSSCLVVIVNLIVDVIYVLLDPRIRIG